jgi:DNA polymerase-3 subunit delta'
MCLQAQHPVSVTSPVPTHGDWAELSKFYTPPTTTTILTNIHIMYAIIIPMSTTSDTIIGHEWAVQLILKAIRSKRIAHAVLITGPEHVGRATLARMLAQALNCTGDEIPCGQCRACKLISAGRHPDLHLVAPDGNTLKIDQIRALQHDLALSPVEGRFRVVILEGMEKATAEASNALLKTLEEPPPSVVLALIAPEPEALLPTIVSRCQPMALRPLAMETVRAALVERWQVEPQLAGRLAQLAGGRLGWAVKAAQDEAVLAQRNQRLDDLVNLIGQSRVERFAYAEEMSGDSMTARETLRLWQTWWRDVMLMASGSHAMLMNTDRLDALHEHASRFGVERASSAASQIAQTLWQLDHNANARLALEVVCLDLPRR